MNIDFRSPNPRPSKTAKTGAASVRMVSARQRRVTPSASAWWRLTRMRSVAQFIRYARFLMIDGLTPTRADFQAKQSGRGGPACHDLSIDATAEARARAIIVPITQSASQVLMGDGANEWVHILNHLVKNETVQDAVNAANQETPPTATKYQVLGNHGINLKSQ